jgi:hypothetical protein
MYGHVLSCICNSTTRSEALHRSFGMRLRQELLKTSEIRFADCTAVQVTAQSLFGVNGLVAVVTGGGTGEYKHLHTFTSD